MRVIVTSIVLLLGIATAAFAQLEVLKSLNLFAQTALVDTEQTTSISGDWLQPGQWSWSQYGSGSVGDKAGELYEGHLGVGYNLLQNLSINVELFGGFSDMNDHGNDPGEDGGLVGLDILFRWHFWKRDRWTIYVDGGAGLMHSDHEIPANGTHFNFRPQAGIGFSLDVDGRARLMAGGRWQHVSNLDKNGDVENPGYDGAMIYAGFTIPF